MKVWCIFTGTRTEDAFHPCNTELYSTGEGVSFSFEAASKKEAANTLMQLRKFTSLTSVATTGTTEDESGIVTMAVTAVYTQPAAMAETQQ